MSLLRKNHGLLIISLVYLFAFLYMLPLRDQTYQDDWAYIQSVRDFVQTGELKVSEWVAPSTVFLIYWGAFFSAIFGFSLKIMHLSNVVLLYFGLVAFYYLLRRLKINEFKSTIFTILLFSFPWVLHFSYTYISEVPYMSLLLISIFFYVKGFQDNRGLPLLIGSLIAGLAFLTRQLGLVLPLAAFIAQLYKSISRRELQVGKFIAALLPFAIIAGLYFLWLSEPGNLTNAQYQGGKYLREATLQFILPTYFGRFGTTYGLYNTFIQRTLMYFHQSIGFLLPIFFIFKAKDIILRFKKVVLKHKKTIVYLFIFYFFLLLLEVTIHFHRNNYSLGVPDLITRNDKLFPINWKAVWKYFVFPSVPIWIVIFSKTISKAFGHLFVKRKRASKTLYAFAVISGILLLIRHFALEFRLAFRPHIPMSNKTEISKIFYIFQNLLFSDISREVFRQAWLVFVLWAAIFLIATRIALYYKLQRNSKDKTEYVLLLLVFFLQASIIITLMFFHWQQYIISLIPFFFIQLAIFTDKLKISFFRLIAVIALLLLFSVSSTKRRYSYYGIRWEIGEKLVQTGVEPIDYYFGDESWLPWWYYQKTFQEEVEKRGGDKYSLLPGQWGTWYTLKSKSKYIYDAKEVTSSYILRNKKPNETITDLGYITHSIFAKKRYILRRTEKDPSPI